MAVHFQEDIECSVNKCGLFLKFSSVETNLMFSARQPGLFSPKLFRINCALLCDSSLFIMSSQDKKSEVFSYFQNFKGEVLARSHTNSSNKGFLNTSRHLC